MKAVPPRRGVRVIYLATEFTKHFHILYIYRDWRARARYRSTAQPSFSGAINPADLRRRRMREREVDEQKERERERDTWKETTNGNKTIYISFCSSCDFLTGRKSFHQLNAALASGPTAAVTVRTIRCELFRIFQTKPAQRGGLIY